MTTEQKIEAIEKQLQELKQEIKPKFKKGDLLAYEYRHLKPSIFIYNNESNCFCCLDLHDEDSDVVFDVDFDDELKIRLATESEKQQLIDKLHENGKDWDAEKLEIVDYRWRAERGEEYFRIIGNEISDLIENNDSTDDRYYKSGNYFKTEALAEIAQQKINELFLTLKHS